MLYKLPKRHGYSWRVWWRHFIAKHSPIVCSIIHDMFHPHWGIGLCHVVWRNDSPDLCVLHALLWGLVVHKVRCCCRMDSWYITCLVHVSCVVLLSDNQLWGSAELGVYYLVIPSAHTHFPARHWFRVLPCLGVASSEYIYRYYSSILLCAYNILSLPSSTEVVGDCPTYIISTSSLWACHSDSLYDVLHPVQLSPLKYWSPCVGSSTMRLASPRTLG